MGSSDGSGQSVPPDVDMVLSCFALSSRRYEQVRLTGSTNEVQVVRNGEDDDDDRNFLQLLVCLTGCVRTVVATNLLLLCLTVLQLKVMSRISPSTLSPAAAAAPLCGSTTLFMGSGRRLGP